MAADRTRKSADSAKKATKKTPTAAKDGSSPPTGTSRSSGSKGASAPRAASKPRRSSIQVAEAASEQLAGLVRKPVEAVTGLARNDDGWLVSLEVVEMRRVPETTDVLALYEVEVDDDGNLTSYRRLDRYARGLPRRD